MSRRDKMIAKIKELMYKPDYIRNIGICAHIDHGKTTLSDNLLAGAGLIAEELAGEALGMDTKQDEQERGITIDAANASMVQEFDGEQYLINLIDTPGHVDFGGDVTRAMRAVDGAVVVVCAVDGVMPQTETVLKQALRENVKPVLFINKVDRLINELKLSPEDLLKQLTSIIIEVNALIKSLAPKEKREEWMVNVEEGSVAFGSAFKNWAINSPKMKETGFTFKDIIDYCHDDKEDELKTLLPLTEVLLNMVVEHLPSPNVAQVYRVPKIWDGDIESEVGQTMIKTSPDGPLAGMITNVTVDKHKGDVATCRIYGGTLERSSEIYMVGSHGKARVQQAGIFMGAETIDTEKVPVGNIAYLTGVKGASAGETICLVDCIIDEFEPIDHISEPVVTVAVEAKNTKDLPKLIEVLRQVSKEDPTIKVEINDTTGEQLISGMGELHLEVVTNRIINDKKLDILVSEPIIVYKESITGKSPTIEGKSPNKHNRFYIEVEPLDKPIYNALIEGDLKEERIKSKETAQDYIELGMDKEEARRVWEIYNRSMFINMTRGIQYLDEVKELLLDGFEDALKDGPLANEEVVGLKFKLVDAKLHEDAVHRGPAQVLPAIKKAIYASIMSANPCLLEPIQKVFISAPLDYMGNCNKEIQNRRGRIIGQETKGVIAEMDFEVPIAEMFGFAGDIRSATGGKGDFSTEMKGFEVLPIYLQDDIVRQIRLRKGLSPEPYGTEHYSA
ncbi:MAG: elongation factor EF-2 [Methanobrevibacter sp.]|nr:elongation factor EF-2 [Methanobrevibacter sp.]